MLNNNQFGYAVMNKDLDAYYFESVDLNTCKRYCLNGDVIVEQIPYKAGFSVRIVWRKWYKLIRIERRLRYGNILWLHFGWNSEYIHKNGKIVYRS